MINSVNTYLETERLALRRFTADDADLLIELDSDPAVMRYLSGGEPTAPEVVRNGHLPNILAGYEKWGGNFGLFAAHEKDSDAFIGWFCLRPEPGGPLDEVELGYRLRRAAWGKGYGTEGSRALIRKGFTELGVRRVFASTMAVNLASRRVMEKAGLTLVRTFHQEWPYVIEGEEHGDVEYALTNADWEQQEAAETERLANNEKPVG